MATGTAAVAIELVRQRGCRVVGLDQSSEMLSTARDRVQQAGLTERIQLVEGSADELPFPDRSFDALTFTYLVRYVEDPRGDARRARAGRATRRSGRRARVRAPRGSGGRSGSCTSASGFRWPVA